MSIKIDLKIFLFAILFFLIKQIKIYALVMVFALLHELAHLVCGLALGLKPSSLKVNPFGFQIEFKAYVEDYNKKVNKANYLCIKKMLIALAGPVFNLCIAFVSFLLQNKLNINIELIIYSNLLLALFNLLPIYPLDGGRVCRALVHIHKGKEKSYQITNVISKISIILLTILAVASILYIHNIALILILAYLWYLVIKNEKIYKMKIQIYKRLA